MVPLNNCYTTRYARSDLWHRTQRWFAGGGRSILFGPQAGYDMASTTRRIAGLDNRVPHVASKSTQPVGSSLSIRPSAHPRECDRSARSRGQHHRDFGARVSSNDSSAPWTPATVTKGKQAGAIAKGRDRPRGRCRAATAASREQREADPASRFSRRAPEQNVGIGSVHTRTGTGPRCARPPLELAIPSHVNYASRSLNSPHQELIFTRLAARPRARSASRISPAPLPRQPSARRGARLAASGLRIAQETRTRAL